MATLEPEMTIRWDTPARLKSSLTSWGMYARRPRRMPSARPAWAAGSVSQRAVRARPVAGDADARVIGDGVDALAREVGAIVEAVQHRRLLQPAVDADEVAET